MLPWDKLTTLHFWFTPYPGPVRGSIMKVLFVLFLILIITAVVLAVLNSMKRFHPLTGKLVKRLQHFASGLGVAGFVILFFFAEQAPYLSSRFWVLLWLIGAAVWLTFIGRFGFIELPKRRAELRRQAELNRYLPHKKGKK